MYQKFIEAINSAYWTNIIERATIMFVVAAAMVLAIEEPMFVAIFAMIGFRVLMENI